MRSVLVWVAAASVVSSCNCGGGGMMGEPGSGTLCGDFSPVLSSLCGVLDRCPNASPIPIAYRSRAECTDILCWSFTCRYDSDTKSVKQTIPPSSAEAQRACSQWLDQAPCTLFEEGAMTGSACEGVLAIDTDDSDAKHVGEDCSQDSCASELYCSQARYLADAGLKTCRVCTAYPAPGEACGPNGCGDKAFCEYPNDGGPNVCRPLKNDGEMCTYYTQCKGEFCNPRTRLCDGAGRAGQSCTTTEDCRVGFCGDDGKCSDLIRGGGACDAGARCANGFCDFTRGACGLPLDAGCSNDGTCASGFCDNASHCAPQQPNGGACTESTECQSNYCDSFQHRCTDHCDTDSDCDAGMLCFYSASSRCEAPRPDGQPCQSDDECAGGNCNADDRCSSRKPVGSPCTSAFDCTFDGYCAGGTCTARAKPGQSCTSGDTCEAPFVCLGATCKLINLACRPAKAGEMCAYFRVCDEQAYCDLAADFTCKARVATGAACTSDEQCLGGYCQSSLCATKKAEGAACTTTNECFAGMACLGGKCSVSQAGTPCDFDEPCPRGYWCTTRDVCQPDLDAGESCSGSSATCASGLYCNGSYRCAATLAPGAECDGYRDGECGAEHSCPRSNGSPYHCEVNADAGESCGSIDRDCMPGLFCDVFTCVEKKANGVHCSDDDACASGICDYSVGCVAGTQCVP